MYSSSFFGDYKFCFYFKKILDGKKFEINKKNE